MFIANLTKSFKGALEIKIGVSLLLLKMTPEMSPDMALLFTMLKEEMHHQTEIITNKVSSSILQSVEEKLNPIIEENKLLKAEIEKLNTRMKSLELQNRRNNVLIHGVEENEHNILDLLNNSVQLLKDTGAEVTSSDIDRIYRLGRKSEEGKPRPILITTTTSFKKHEILKNKKKMINNSYITEDFTKETLEKRKLLQAELKQAREAGHQAIIRNNKIVIKGMKENKDKRRRSESTSPVQGSFSQTNAAKMHKPEERTKNNPETRIVVPTAANKNEMEVKQRRIDAFQVMRERAYSLSEKNTYLN